MHRTLLSLALAAAVVALASSLAAAELPNPFYAMDTSFQRPGSLLEQQLDVVKELGYAGVAWHDQPVEQLRPVLSELDKRGLKMYTTYFGATATPEGNLSPLPNLPAAMDLLQGRGTVLWLHIGGRGPAFASLTEQTPIVQELRKMAEAAKAHDLRIVLYPHVGDWTARVPDCVRLAKTVNHPNFGVGFNLCHALATGDEANIPAMLDEAKPWLMAATICGADAGVKGDKWKRLIQTLDKGTYDVRIVLRKLREIGYTGPIGFQGYALPGDARSILVPTMNGWRKLNATLDDVGPTVDIEASRGGTEEPEMGHVRLLVAEHVFRQRMDARREGRDVLPGHGLRHRPMGPHGQGSRHGLHPLPHQAPRRLLPLGHQDHRPQSDQGPAGPRRAGRAAEVLRQARHQAGPLLLRRRLELARGRGRQGGEGRQQSRK